MSASTATSVPAAIRRWHQVAEARDIAGLNALLADEAVFQSPVVHTPQVGKAITARYLTAAFQVLNNGHFRYRNEWFGPNSAVLEFETVVDGIEVNGVDIITWDASDRIVSFKVMIRPLKAINMVFEHMRATLTAMSA